jgi:hypothetical protein
VIDRPEQERQRQDAERGRAVADRRHVDPVDVDRPDPGLLDGLIFLTELAGMENPNPVPPAGSLRHQPVHEQQGLHGRIVALGDPCHHQSPDARQGE